jgi:hypothetical protein
MKTGKLLILILPALLLNSCILFFKEVSVKTVSKTGTAQNYFILKTYYHAHCGCTDIYAIKYEQGYKVYELHPPCSKFYKPQKILYTYDPEGRLVNKSRYEIITGDYFTIKPGEADSLAMAAINSYVAAHPGGLTKCNTAIKGFVPMEE